jgi:hypothetical protein
MIAKRVTGTGAATAARSRLLGVSLASGATAGRFTVTDGSGGATLFDQDTPASVTTPVFIPTDADDGILATVGLYVSAITNISAATLLIGS